MAAGYTVALCIVNLTLSLKNTKKVTLIREYWLLLTLLYTFFFGGEVGGGEVKGESFLHTWFWDAAISFCSMFSLETICFCMNHNFFCFLKFFASPNIKYCKYLSNCQTLNFGKEPLLRSLIQFESTNFDLSCSWLVFLPFTLLFLFVSRYF